MSQQEFEHYLSLLARMLRLTPQQRDAIADELRSHLEERLAELQEQGHERDEAIRLALDEFGDANAFAHDFTQTVRHAAQRKTRRRLMQTTAGTLIAAAAVTFVVMTLTPNNFRGTPTQPPAIAETTEPANATPSEASAGMATIEGRVGNPGPISVPADGVSLNQFLNLAEGVQIRDGDRVTVNIQHNDPDNDDLSLSFEDALEHGDEIQIRPGMHVDVTGPSRKGFVYVMGDINRPGTYTVPGPDRLSLKQLVASAGGLHADRDPESQRITVVRRTPDDGEEITVTTWAELEQRELPFFLRPEDLVRIDLHPDFAPALANRFAVLDIAPLIRNVVSLEPDNGTHIDVLEIEAELVESVMHVLEGLGHADDFSVVRSWMGTLTVVGNEEAVEAVRAYLRQIEGMIEMRVARQAMESERGANADAKPTVRLSADQITITSQNEEF